MPTRVLMVFRDPIWILWGSKYEDRDPVCEVCAGPGPIPSCSRPPSPGAGEAGLRSASDLQLEISRRGVTCHWACIYFEI